MATENQPGRSVAHSLKTYSILLFSNFFLIILAYYQVKSASRSLLIEYWGSSSFPWLWIASALVLGGVIGFYHRLVERYSRLSVVLGSALILMISHWLPLGDNAVDLSWLTLLICSAWVVVLALLAREHHAFIDRQPAAA